jgi:putative hemolysin
VKQFGRIPAEGESIIAQGFQFEVLDMDTHRIDKILVLPIRKE